jgi:beta-fructofuranosidase
MQVSEEQCMPAIHEKELRPTYHYAAPENWLNDPNGIIYWNGYYHLFYQYHPYAATWGIISWGHARSKDLVHWETLPIAMNPTPDSPDERGVWSGCTLVHNGLVHAFYTGARGDKYETQTVCLAISRDKDLITWEKYEANPILAAPPDEFSGCGFRDPFIWRDGDVWKMVIGAGVTNGAEAVLLYQSSDLYHWDYLSPLIVSDAHNEDIYECPNFFPLGDDKWVLLVSVMSSSRVDYFVGLFWNNHFVIETHGTIAEAPFFAPYTFEQGGRRLLIGWLKEMRPVVKHQAAGWAGAMSLPIELMLLDNNLLALTPVREVLDEKITDHYCLYENVTPEMLSQIQAEMGSRLKVVISDDLSKVLFVDGSVVEFFDFPNYTPKRVYNGRGLECLKEFVQFPVKQLSVWTMPD